MNPETAKIIVYLCGLAVWVVLLALVVNHFEANDRKSNSLDVLQPSHCRFHRRLLFACSRLLERIRMAGLQVCRRLVRVLWNCRVDGTTGSRKD